jgi:hypothetical protein
MQSQPYEANPQVEDDGDSMDLDSIPTVDHTEDYMGTANPTTRIPCSGQQDMTEQQFDVSSGGTLRPNLGRTESNGPINIIGAVQRSMRNRDTVSGQHQQGIPLLQTRPQRAPVPSLRAVAIHE